MTLVSYLREVADMAFLAGDFDKARALNVASDIVAEHEVVAKATRAKQLALLKRHDDDATVDVAEAVLDALDAHLDTLKGYRL